jgi:hypothetical protein
MVSRCGAIGSIPTTNGANTKIARLKGGALSGVDPARLLATAPPSTQLKSFFKLKASLRNAAAGTKEELWGAISKAIEALTHPNAKTTSPQSDMNGIKLKTLQSRGDVDRSCELR